MELSIKSPDARFLLNMSRIKGLVALSLSDNQDLRPNENLQYTGVGADLMRSIVVFLHATFEDLLRTTARRRIVAADSEILNDIPLIGTSKSGRPEKFHLGALERHRAKTVDQVISESVEVYLNRANFSSCADVERLLLQMSLDARAFKTLFPDLEQMMQRRHRIVHEADIPRAEGKAPLAWTFGDQFNLSVWLLTIAAFHGQLRVLINQGHEVDRWFLANRMRCIDRMREIRTEMAALRNQPAESVMDGLRKAVKGMGEAMALLASPSNDDLLLIWEKTRSPEDHMTLEEARDKLAAWRKEVGL